jgi:hypothetical protein
MHTPKGTTYINMTLLQISPVPYTSLYAALMPLVSEFYVAKTCANFVETGTVSRTGNDWVFAGLAEKKGEAKGHLKRCQYIHTCLQLRPHLNAESFLSILSPYMKFLVLSSILVALDASAAILWPRHGTTSGLERSAVPVGNDGT